MRVFGFFEFLDKRGEHIAVDFAERHLNMGNGLADASMEGVVWVEKKRD